MIAIEKAKTIIKKYRHAWIFLYAFIYMPWFMYLEEHITSSYYIIHSPLDNFIPFIEYFIIPYYLWFPFMVIGVLYFFFTNRDDFYRVSAFCIVGMTLFLIICSIFPNGLHLRPVVFSRDNFFVDLVKGLYATDTPTNVLPSIHVFNTLGVLIAVSHSERLKQHKFVVVGTYILGILIILSTMFLKQHSVTDVIAAGAMACVIYPFIYTHTAYSFQMQKESDISLRFPRV